MILELDTGWGGVDEREARETREINLKSHTHC